MSDEIIEKCRQALWDHHCPGIRRTVVDDEFYREAVKVIIKALKEPDDDLLTKWMDVLENVGWDDMIDEILRN